MLLTNLFIRLGSASSAKERKHKCSSEQYVRERKSNAQKQFAYNKLKNEKHASIKHENRKSCSAPKRPPQPKLVNVEKKEKDGMLIDLTSPQQQDVNISAIMSNDTFDCNFVSKMHDISILDAPIDVPTERYTEDEMNAVGLFGSEKKPEPPPYHSPPNYMNTFLLNKPTLKYASSSTIATSQYGNLDPFDTSHIVSTQSQSMTMSSHAYSTEDNSDKFIRNQIQTTSCKDLGYISRPRPTTKSEIDEIVQCKMASLSPRIGQRASSATTVNSIGISSDTKQVNQSPKDSSPKVLDNCILNDSLQVNLSSLTLNDSDDFETQALPSTSIDQNPKLDRAFLAELEKEMYKNDNAASNVNVNNAQINEFTFVNTKDNTVSAISNSLNWLKNDIAINDEVAVQIYQQKNTVTMHSPAKYNNESIKLTNNESASTNMTLSKKLYNAEINSAHPSSIYASSAKQMGLNNVTTPTMNSSNQSVYSNYAMTNNNSASHDQKYNFVTSLGGTNIKNIYSVSSDIYGSTAGANVYDVVASSNSEYYQTIQPNDVQSVIYDEVAVDDIRPHRPAPPAPGLPILSAQQIQRRLERAQKDQTQQLYGNLESNYVNNVSSNAAANHSIYEEINQKTNTISSCNDVLKDTLNAANSGTIKNMKIEQLLR